MYAAPRACWAAGWSAWWCIATCLLYMIVLHMAAAVDQAVADAVCEVAVFPDDPCCSRGEAVCGADPGCSLAPVLVATNNTCVGRPSQTVCEVDVWCIWNAITRSCFTEAITDIGPCMLENEGVSTEQFDIVKQQACSITPLCLDLCSQCSFCVARTYALVVTNVFKLWSFGSTPLSFSTTIVASFMRTNTNITALLGAAAVNALADMTQDTQKGIIALQPYGLCLSLGLCPEQRYCPTLASLARTFTGESSACAYRGFTASGSLEAMVVAGCYSDDMCPQGQGCDRWGPPANPMGWECDARDGLSYHVAMGTCKPRCSLPAVQTRASALRSALTPCNTTADCSSPGKSACLLASPGVDAAWASAAACGSVGAPSPPTISSVCVATSPDLTGAASFVPGSSLILAVQLSVSALPWGPAACGQVLSPATAALLGMGGGHCQASGQALSITLGALSTLSSGDQIVLRGGQLGLVDMLGQRPFIGTATLAPCPGCPSPVVILTGPRWVATPCQAGTMTPVVFDASGSRDPGLARWREVRWSVVNGSVAGPATLLLQAQVQNASTGPNQPGRLQLVLSELDISALPIGQSLTLSVFLTTWQFVTSHASFTFTRNQSSDQTPSFVLLAPATATLGTGLALTVSLQGGSATCTSGSTTSSVATYVWSCDWPELVPLSATGPGLVIPEASLRAQSVRVGQLLVFTVKVFMTQAALATAMAVIQLEQAVTILADPLVAVLEGPAGWVSSTATTPPVYLRTFLPTASSSQGVNASWLGFSGQGTHDPSDLQTLVDPLRFYFSCAPAGSPLSSCFLDGSYTGITNKWEWQLQGSQLVPNVDLLVRLDVAKGGVAGLPLRTASATLVMHPVAEQVLGVSVVRHCGWDARLLSPITTCPTHHSQSNTLVLVANVFFAPGSAISSQDWADVRYMWSDPWFSDAFSTGLSVLQVGDNTLAINLKSLPLQPHTGPVFDLQVTVTLPDGRTGRAYIHVPLAQPPACDGGVLSPMSDVAAPSSAAWVLGPQCYAHDGGQLTYEAGLVDVGYSSWNQGTPQAVSALPTALLVHPGQLPLQRAVYMCARDRLGGRTCLMGSLTRSPASSLQQQTPASVASTVAGINMAQLAASGDPSAVTLGVWQVLAAAQDMSGQMNVEVAASLAASLDIAITTLAQTKSVVQAGLLLVAISELECAAPMSDAQLVASGIAQAAATILETAVIIKHAVPVGVMQLALQQCARAAKAVWESSGNTTIADLSTSTSVSQAVQLLLKVVADAALLLASSSGATASLNAKDGITLPAVYCSVTVAGTTTQALAGSLPYLTFSLPGMRAAASIALSGRALQAWCLADSLCSQQGLQVMAVTGCSSPAMFMVAARNWPQLLLPGATAGAVPRVVSALMIEVQLLNRRSRSKGLCGPAPCDMTVVLPLDKSLYTPGIPVVCAGLWPLMDGVSYEVEVLPGDAVVLMVGSGGSGANATATVRCTTPRLGKLVVLQAFNL